VKYYYNNVYIYTVYTTIFSRYSSPYIDIIYSCDGKAEFSASLLQSWWSNLMIFYENRDT